MPRKNEVPPMYAKAETGAAARPEPVDSQETVAIVAVSEERKNAGDDKTADSLQEEAPRTGGANWTAAALLLAVLLLMVVISTQHERWPGLLDATVQRHVDVEAVDPQHGDVSGPQAAAQQTPDETAAAAKDDNTAEQRHGEQEAMRIERERVEQPEQLDEEEQRTQSDGEEEQDQRSQL